MLKAPIAALMLTAALAAASEADAANCTRVFKPLVVQISFADIKRTPKRKFVETRFLSDPDRYIREMSYGKSCMAGTLTAKLYRLPGSTNDYYVPWQNLKVDKNKLKKLIADTFVQVERDYDVRRFDFIVFALMANAREWGNQGLNTYPGLLGWKDDSALVTPSGRKVKGGVAIYALSANVGKVFHNIAHIMAGVSDGRRILPDMYDQDTASASTLQASSGVIGEHAKAEASMGSWDPMSCGMCAKLSGAPGLTAWSRLRLGWLDAAKIRTVQADEQVEVRLGALGDGSAATLAIRIPLTADTYYLVENRQKIGYDQNLPAAGVLITYGDDTIPEPRHGAAPVRLVSTGGSPDAAAFDVGAKSTFYDSERRVTVRVLRKVGNAYDVRVER